MCVRSVIQIVVDIITQSRYDSKVKEQKTGAINMTWTTTKTLNTKHKATCSMSFGRKDSTCPRCQELLNGSKPRASYHAKYKLDQDRKTLQIKNHVCTATCGTVCTAFEY